MTKREGAMGQRVSAAAVSDSEVDRTIAIAGGDGREAVRALLYALHNMVSRAPAPPAGAREAGRLSRSE